MYLSVTKLNLTLDEALYKVPAAFLMLMIYELARMHDNTIFTLIEREAIDGNRRVTS